MADGDKAVWAADCSSATPNVALTAGTNAATIFTVPDVGTGYKLCYRPADESNSLEQSGVTLTAVAATSAATITSISPASITTATATSITLSGTATAGDLVIWVDSSVLAKFQSSHYFRHNSPK